MARATKSKTKKKSLADLPPEPDPRAPLDGAFLVAALQPVRKELEKDLLARAKASAALTRALSARHAEEKKEERTADDYASWLRRFVEQVAAAWILSCVFVRTLEDRGLLEAARIAGPGALDAQRTFLQLAPSLSEREYLLTIFREMTRLPAAAGLFDHHNPAWMLAPSAEGARALLQLFRTGGADAPALRFGQASTRFLGDLYQDLNENVRKRYALLQTPDFVERFILDRTLEPAIEAFGLDETDLIDPTCGSGHFLLGAFDRLFEHRRRASPGTSARDAALAALDKVHGADVNPYAVAIARFRLTLSFLEKAEYTRISDAPELKIHVAVADSLLYNPQHAQRELFHQEGVDAAAWERRAFDFEDEREARDVLHKQYAAVVGNPPYITVKDKTLRDRYRALYPSAAGKYALSVPFCERFFQLARDGGRVGQITANSFMKREFGKKLIEDFLPSVDLDLIVNTSGAYIPGHGTPTVLLFGANRAPKEADVLAVLAKRGEPTTPADPARGQVWSSIVDHGSEVGYEDDYISVARVERASLAAHPWSLGGGGASELKALLEERASERLGDRTTAIGFDAIMGEDELFFGTADWFVRLAVTDEHVRDLGVGENVRDWSVAVADRVLFPYDDALSPVIPPAPRVRQHFWRYRRQLIERRQFGKNTIEAGLQWFEYRSFYKSKRSTPLSITFAFVATHNHFVLDRGGKVFKQTAPIIKLPETATEEDHLALLAYLNSSTACFWMKQVLQNRGYGADASNARTTSVPWEDFYEFAGTPLKEVPLPAGWQNLSSLGRELDELSSKRANLAPTEVLRRWLAEGGDLRSQVEQAEADESALLNRMVIAQERLDWIVYSQFDLHQDPTLIGPADDRIGRRAFEYGLCVDPTRRDIEALWFRRSGVAVPPTGSGDAIQQRRGVTIEESKELRLLESTDFKRWWRSTDYATAVRTAAVEVLADVCEQALMQLDHVLAASQLVSRVKDRPELAQFLDFADTLEGRPMPELMAADAVPYLAAWRYTDAGLETRAAWERTWELQRKEDAGEDVGDIPVPPKYAQKDFRSATYWRLRGKLDVPKERFISYPGCESDEDREPVYGWAGWDHAQRAQALVALYQDRKTRESWDRDRLTPILAGLLELLPWLKQWHDQPMPDFDSTVFEAYDAFLDTELRDLALTRDDLRSWRPPDKKRALERGA